MPSERRAPPPQFAHEVEACWTARRDFSGEHAFTITPDGYADLVVFDRPVVLHDGARATRLPSCALIGPVRRPLELRSDGEVRCGGIRMNLWAFGLLSVRYTDGRTWRDGASLVPRALPEISAALASARVGRILDALDLALPEMFLPSAADRAAMWRLFQTTPTPSVDRVAAHLGVGRRQAQRRLKSWTNLPPQQLASIVRFQRVRDRLWERPSSSLAELAADCGYADQAHLTREFKRYAGVTPVQFRRQCERQQRGAPRA